MSKSALAPCAALLLTAACATTPPPATPATPVESAIATHRPQGPLPSEVVVQPVLPAYICPDGQRIELDHDVPAGVMRVARGGEAWVLQEQVRKGNAAPSFVTDEDTLTLYQGEMRVEMKRGSTARMTCQQVPAEPSAGVLWGTLSKMDRMALVPGSRAKVLLVDAARADAPHIEIASTSIVTSGNQVPLHWLIRYDTGKVAPRPLTYRLMARIETPAGQLTHITDTAFLVLESDETVPPVELDVVRAGNPAG